MSMEWWPRLPGGSHTPGRESKPIGRGGGGNWKLRLLVLLALVVILLGVLFEC